METVPSPGFGTLLRRYRVAAGLSQEELAERAGLSVRTVGDLERSASKAPRKDTVDLLAKALALAAPERAALAAAARRLSTASSASSALPTPAGTSAPALVGRRRELALLERHLAGQGPPVLLLAGEPGIGKTRLLHAALPRAAGHGLRVLEGGCQRRGGHEPYAPLLGALQRHIRHQAPAQQRTELAGCAWLLRLLPELATGPIEPLPTWTLPPEQERRLMVEAVLRFLANVAGPAGTLLVLDDLQWAGPDALELLTVLARAAAEVPLRVLGAYRHTEVGPQDALSVLLADLAQAGLATQHTLPPLTPQEAGQLLGGLLADGAGAEPLLQQRVLQRAGGVPFVLVSCAQALRTAEGADGTADRIPWDVAQGLRQRVAGLSAAAQEVLGVAAVVGRVVAPALLTAVAAQGEEDVLAACEAACRAGLLEEAGTEGYQFAHDVIREVVEADLGAARRTALHRRVADVLEWRAGAPPVELLAYHYARSDAQDKALLYLEQAGDRAQAQYAYAAAETYYRALVERLDGLGRVLDAARAREKLGTSLYPAARFDAALEALEGAARTWQTAGDRERLQRTLAHVGRLHALRDTPDEGLARLQLLQPTVAGSTPSPGLAALYAALAWLYLACGRRTESVGAAERAADLARAVGEDGILADVEVRRGTALFQSGHLEEGRRVLEGALPLVEAATDGCEPLYRLHNNLGVIHKYQGQFDQGMRYRERALEVGEQIGDLLGRQWALAGLGEVLFLRGDWGAARARLGEALDLVRSRGWSLLAGYALEGLVQLHLARGEWEEASRCLEEGVALAHHSVDLRMWPHLQRLLAERDVLEGCPDAALARLSPLLDHPGTAEIELTPLLPLVAWAYLERGEDAEAARMVETGIRRARAQNHRLALVDALRVQALVAIRQERWDEAQCSLQEGLSLARSMPYPYAEARLLHVYGAMHVQKGEPEPARERLEAALAIFRRLGARKDVERVEQALTDLQRP